MTRLVCIIVYDKYCVVVLVSNPVFTKAETALLQLWNVYTIMARNNSGCYLSVIDLHTTLFVIHDVP